MECEADGRLVRLCIVIQSTLRSSTLTSLELPYSCKLAEAIFMLDIFTTSCAVRY